MTVPKKELVEELLKVSTRLEHVKENKGVSQREKHPAAKQQPATLPVRMSSVTEKTPTANDNAPQVVTKSASGNVVPMRREPVMPHPTPTVEQNSTTGVDTSPTAPTTESSSKIQEELMLPKVTEGLSQLLSAWDVFKSSGLFGLGPGGVEHPTYKKIAQLKVPAVFAGRWDGADEKVVASIRAYVNGWKEEQDIVAHPEESFEEYLRRVILHILDAPSVPPQDGTQKAA